MKYEKTRAKLTEHYETNIRIHRANTERTHKKQRRLDEGMIERDLGSYEDWRRIAKHEREELESWVEEKGRGEERKEKRKKNVGKEKKEETKKEEKKEETKKEETKKEETKKEETKKEETKKEETKKEETEGVFFSSPKMKNVPTSWEELESWVEEKGRGKEKKEEKKKEETKKEEKKEETEGVFCSSPKMKKVPTSWEEL